MSQLISFVLHISREGANFIGLHQGQQGGEAKSFWEEKNDGANTFSEEKNDGADTFLGKKNDGARTFLQKKNDGAKTFYGMNSYNSHKIYRKYTSAGLLFRIMKWGAKTFFGEKNDGA